MLYSISFTNLLKAHILDVHLPNILIGIGASIEVPLITTLGRRIGASSARIAHFVMISALFRSMMDIPYGIIVEYIGVRNVMLASLFLNVVACTMGLFIVDAMTLAAFCIMSGISLGGFFLSRHIFVAGITSKKYRGMLMAFLSGLLRWAHVIGPVMSGYIASRTGDVRNAFYLAVATSMCAFGTVTIASLSTTYQECCQHSCSSSCMPSEDEERDEYNSDDMDDEKAAAVAAYQAKHPVVAGAEDCGAMLCAHPQHPHAHLVHPSLTQAEDHHFNFSILWKTCVRCWGDIWRLGIFCVLYTALRSNRKLMLAIAAMRHNLSDADLSYMISLSFSVDAVFFPLGGIVMDKLGRHIAVVPVSLAFGVVFIGLACANTNVELCLVAVAFGLADALGCGLMMTLTADRAPKKYGAPFFGIMRTIQDLGHVFGNGFSSLLLGRLSFPVVCL
ncbi:drug resistance protein, partial [Strigomonas culicis]